MNANQTLAHIQMIETKMGQAFFPKILLCHVVQWEFLKWTRQVFSSYGEVIVEDDHSVKGEILIIFLSIK